MMLPVRYRAGLRHRDRWRVAEMLRENPDLLCHDPGRDMISGVICSVRMIWCA
jgi:hypothetical protein